jgi:hypothetical protein
MSIKFVDLLPFVVDDCNCNLSEGIKYHLTNNISILENVYRPSSKKYFELFQEARELQNQGIISLTEEESDILKNTNLGKFGMYEGMKVPLDFPMSHEYLMEVKQGNKNVELNKPKRNPSGKKKYVVFVKTPKGTIRKIQFGDVHGGLKARVANPEARRLFSKRHNCPSKNDKTKAGYWTCRMNRYPALNNGKTYPGFW